MIKSVHDMTADEIAKHRKDGTTVYHVKMWRHSRIEGNPNPVFSDMEDFCPWSLRKHCRDARMHGWKFNDPAEFEALDKVCKEADAQFSNMAFGKGL